MNTTRVSFVNRRGDELSGYLDVPSAEKTVGYGILAHCFTCGKDLKPFANLSSAVTEAGVALLRFDFSGIGESGGEFAETTLLSNAEDVADAGAYLTGSFEAPKLLVGHSLGGLAVLRSAGSMGSVKAVVTIGTPADAGHLGARLRRTRDEAERTGEGSVQVGGRTFRLGKRFFDDLASTDMKDVIASIGKALLVLHSPADEMVPVENAGRIFAEARHPKSMVSLAEADHLLLKQEDAAYAGRIIAVWARRYF